MTRISKRTRSSEGRVADLALRNWKNNDCEEEM